jgi:hypothetical protein
MIAALIALGIGAVGLAFADRLSRPVDVTVESADGHGHCRVTWRDPWSHQVRHGPFSCPLDGWYSPLQAGDVTAESVADWPWRGHLYDEDLTGGPGFAVSVSVAVSAAVVLVGTVFTALFRKFSGRFTRAKDTAGPRALAEAGAEPVHARLAEAAESQWAATDRDFSRPPPVWDVHTVPWWRVRGLTWTATGLVQLIASLILVVEAANGYGAEGTARKLLHAGFALVFGTLAVQQILQTVRTASTLARAARSPLTQTRRYVAVRVPRSGDFWMLLFPADSGPNAVPDAALLLCSGRAARRRHGFPTNPVGDVELHSDPAHPRVVVPWFEGRPVWPRGQLPTIEPDDPMAGAFLRLFTSSDSATVGDGHTSEDIQPGRQDG